MKAEFCLKCLLRTIGTASLLALVAVIMPYRWMDAIHHALGMGQLPAEPVVGYLARSTSAFYAILGGLLWVVSGNVRYYRVVINYLGGAFVFLGLALLAVDWLEGLPLFWKAAEGPIDTLFGVLILYLNHRSVGSSVSK